MFIEILSIPVLFLLGLSTVFTIYWLVHDEIMGVGFISRKNLFIFLLTMGVILSAVLFGLWYLTFLIPVIWLHLDYYDKFPKKVRDNTTFLWQTRMAILATMITFNIHVVLRLMIANL